MPKKNRTRRDYLASNMQQYAVKRAWLDTLKARPCVDCQRVYPPCVMDFDHVRGTKEFGIGRELCSKGKPALLREIAKCDVVCANCHRIRTHILRKK